jgi:transposase
MARHGKGTTPKLTEELISAMSAAIRGGAYVETAAALCGISKDSLYRWLRQSEQAGAKAEFRALSDAVKKAMAEAELRDLAVIDKAAQEGVWTAAAWRLERKHPEKWGRQARVQIEHSGPNGAPISLEARREGIKKLLGDPAAAEALELLERKIKGEA